MSGALTTSRGTKRKSGSVIGLHSACNCRRELTQISCIDYHKSGAASLSNLISTMVHKVSPFTLNQLVSIVFSGHILNTHVWQVGYRYLSVVERRKDESMCEIIFRRRLGKTQRATRMAFILAIAQCILKRLAPAIDMRGRVLLLTAQYPVLEKYDLFFNQQTANKYQC